MGKWFDINLDSGSGCLESLVHLRNFGGILLRITIDKFLSGLHVHLVLLVGSNRGLQHSFIKGVRQLTFVLASVAMGTIVKRLLLEPWLTNGYILVLVISEPNSLISLLLRC